MSRVVTAHRLMRRLRPVTPAQSHFNSIETACRKVHRECLYLISANIAAETEPSVTSTEDMALLLSCAQIAQSTATLARTGSLQLSALISACADIFSACIEHPFSHNLHADRFNELRSVCRQGLHTLR